MRLLLATSLLPSDAATSGYEIANRALLLGLRALGHEIVPIGFADPEKTEKLPDGAINLGELLITNSDVDLRQKMVWLIRAIQNSTTFAGAKLQTLTHKALEAIIKHQGHFDGVIVNGAPMAAAFEKVLTVKPFIYIAHNVEWQAAAESAKAAQSLFEQKMFVREAKYLKRLEQRLAAKASHIFTLAPDDSDKFAEMGAISVSEVPLIVGVNAEPPALRAPKWDAGLIGTWSWAPNRIGLDWFLNEVTPHLPDDFRFAVAGKLPGNPIIKHPGAKILGRVPSAIDFTRDCSCLPLVSRAGSGVQLKTLEAFELGLPSVATLSSVRGISHLPENCTVENDPKQFAKALISAAKISSAADIDGRLFHARQKEKMLGALNKSISVFQASVRLEAAC